MTSWPPKRTASRCPHVAGEGFNLWISLWGTQTFSTRQIMRGRQSRAEEENTACTSEANLRKVCSLNVHPVPSYVVNRCLTRSSGEVRVLVRVFVLHNILAWVPRTFGQVVVQSLGRVRLFATLWTVAHQAPLSIGFSKPEYWSGLPFPSPGDLPTPGIKATSPALHVDSLPIESFSSVQFSRSVLSDSLRPHESQHTRPPCPSPTPRVHSNSCPLSRWCHPAISSSVFPFSSCPQSLPASEYFPMSQLFAWGGQSIRASPSASVLPMNIQDWSPLGWTGWISLQSKGPLRVFSNTSVQKHPFFSIQPSLWSSSHICTW